MEVHFTHDIQVAHRLFKQPGKCQNIHGHSMTVNMTLYGAANDDGIFEGLDFSAIKKVFRSYLDENFDHRLLLNKDDPWARALAAYDDVDFVNHGGEAFEQLPGLQLIHIGDPTTENLAKIMYEYFRSYFNLPCRISIDETATNAVSYDGED